MSVWVALLRGINVGGAHRVRMPDLVRVFDNVGAKYAQTYIQSGNVVFSGAFASNPEIESILETAFAKEFGFAVDFVARSKEMLEAAIARNPFSEAAASDPKRLLVTFFKQAPDPEAEPRGVAQEQVRIIGAEAYVYYPAGIANSKLRLPGVGTARNWNTVLKLKELADAVAART